LGLRIAQDESAPLKLPKPPMSGEDIIQLAIRLGLLALLIYWSLVLLRPFIPILAWSAVLAVAFNPIYRRFVDLLGGRRKTAAVILTIIGLGIVIGPATWLALSAVDGLKTFAVHLSLGDLALPAPPEALRSWPLLGSHLYDAWQQASTNLSAALDQIAPHLKPIATTLLGMVGNIGVETLQFLLSVALAGFIFPFGPQLVAASRDLLSRIVPEQSEHFVELAGATIRAVSQGVIGVAVIQALLAGIGFKLAGVAGAGLLALAVMMLSIVQIGAAIVMIPVIIWIWTAKDFTAALIWTIFFVAVALLDNVLKPLVMGRGLTTPTLVILIGVIGGTLAHGLLGLFIGPVILSVAWELTVAWIHTDRARRRRRQSPDIDLDQRPQ